MRKQYVLDVVRRRGRVQGAGDAADGGPRAAGGGRRGLVLALLAGAGVLAAGLAWHTWIEPAATAPSEAAAPVPEHQRSGPLANPWGNAAPVTSTPADDAAAAAAQAAAAAGASAPSPFVPPAPAAVRQALARLRGGGEGLAAGRDAPAFMKAALQGGDGAALVAAWMAERQCRHLMHWRRIDEWRRRANPQAPAAAARPGPEAGAVAVCEAMPDTAAVEEALAAAGFPPIAGGGPELTRRPIDLAQAVAVGDALLLAEVMEATEGEAAQQLLRAWGADARDLESPEVMRAALWLASCTPLDVNGRPGGAAALKRACAEHPALSQACLNHGMCDARDLRDLLLRMLQPGELATAERLGRGVVSRMGR